ncbi:class I SAM-dependent methyltransferase [Patescibacteria group bacterium]|nr:class I SAM-dependent methyltransferase [Patescibacteria group bacterium]
MNKTIQAYDEGDFLDWKLQKEKERNDKDDLPFWHDEINEFLSLVSTGDIVEIGPGPGIEARQILSRGKFSTYTGIEPALKLAKISKLLLRDYYCDVRVEIVNSTIEDYLADRKFNALVAVCSLVHVNFIFISEVLFKLRDMCEDGAYSWIVMNEREDSGLSKTDYQGKTFYFYDFDDFKKMLQKSGFKTLEGSKVIAKGGRNWQVFYLKAV